MYSHSSKGQFEILKETGYPISMDDVNLSSVEVQYYMNENQNEVSSPIIYNKPEQLSELKKSLEMLSDGTVLGKTGTGRWASLKVVIDGMEQRWPGLSWRRMFRNL